MGILQSTMNHESIPESAQSTISDTRVQDQQQSAEPNTDQYPDIRIALTSFTLFPKLPIELRFLIWKLAHDEPRVLNISKSDRAREPFSPSTYRVRPMSSPPPLLHTNREARKIGLELRQLCFKSMLNNKPMYYSFAKDSLLLDGVETCYCFTHHYFNCSPLRGLRHLAKANDEYGNLPGSVQTVIYRPRGASLRALRDFHSVERLVVCRDDSWPAERYQRIVLKNLSKWWRAKLGSAFILPKISVLSRAEMDRVTNNHQIDEQLIQERLVPNY
ncbi:uncharacterized protein LY89DRAFT_785150 [Mollisia scopiformis]|uniref:2EXR domain-containing protein n=1 Tax=Mollisia scopiformis TaxID=149040 RepID=A0A194WZT5_MOLSC|nr:uncharacterized protein LY89DRAFT_785150 [Mollisia scopiformis]KUJ13453.1 hypothetical protein LY89DRAFT_785150 [Mollisia scopiformis]